MCVCVCVCMCECVCVCDCAQTYMSGICTHNHTQPTHSHARIHPPTHSHTHRPLIKCFCKEARSRPRRTWPRRTCVCVCVCVCACARARAPFLTSPHLTSPHHAPMLARRAPRPPHPSPHLPLSLLLCDASYTDWFPASHLDFLRSYPLLTSPHLTSPHLTSPHLTSPHLT